MTFDPAAQEEAGLVAIQNDRSAFSLTMAAGSEANMIRLKKSLHGELTLLAEAPLDGNGVYLRIVGDYLHYDFQFSTDGNAWTSLAGNVDVTSLSPAVIDGYNYTGVYLGLYATANGMSTDNYADFDFFNYEPTATSRDGWFERQLGNETQE
jgi:alpha-N-arabinofuranosidase